MDTKPGIQHCFERAGLGLAPFKYTGSYESRGPITLVQNGVEVQVGAPGQPMGSCAYCGQGIAILCGITSSDGKKFVVGSDCVNRTGDAGLVDYVKRDVARRRTAMRHEREAAQLREAKLKLPTLQEAWSKLPHPRGFEGKSLYDWAVWMMLCAGAKGHKEVYKRMAQ